MTKLAATPSLISGVVVAALLWAAGSAAAHGAPSAREVDVRVLLDTTTAGDYGAHGALDEGAFDLLAVDAREAYDRATREPILVLRVLLQGGDSTMGVLTVQLSFTLGPTSSVYEFSTEDGTNFTHNFDEFRGPIPVGDGYPQAFDATLRYSTLGATAGAVIEDLRLESRIGETLGDVAPGTWFYQGREIPASPAETADPGRYALQGPPALFDVDADVPHLDLSQVRSRTVRLEVINRLTTMNQSIDLAAELPEGLSATWSPQSVTLGTNETASSAGIHPPGHEPPPAPAGASTRSINVSLTRDETFEGGLVRFFLMSDLGGLQRLELHVMGVAPEGGPDDGHAGKNSTDPHREEAGHDDHEASDHAAGTDDGHDHASHEHPAAVPGPGLLMVTAGALVGLWWARRPKN